MDRKAGRIEGVLGYGREKTKVLEKLDSDHYDPRFGPDKTLEGH